MRVVEATDRAVSIWLSGEDLHGPGCMTELVRQALNEAGLRPWTCAEADVFTAGEEVLLIARPGRLKGFYFSDLQALIRGALACADVPSALYLCPDGYLLVLSPKDARSGLYQTGDPRCLAPDWERHAAEHGIFLLTRDAVRMLRAYFAP